MPRLTKSVPSYRKHKASGQAFVELCGHRHYLGSHSSKASLIAYDRLVAEFLTNGRRLAHAPEPLTIIELCSRYRQFAEAYYQKNGKPTCLHRIQQALKALRQLYGHEYVDHFGPIALKAVRQQLIDRCLSRRYINELIACIRRMFKWGAAEELVSPQVPQALALVAGLRRGKTTARETPAICPVTDAAIEATMRYLPPVVADMVQLQRLTGMRPQEVCVLRPLDLDRSGDVWLYRLPSYKTEHYGRERVVPLGYRVQEILKSYLDRAPNQYCFCPAQSEARRLTARANARRTPLSCGNRPGSNRQRSPRRKPGARYDVAAYRRAIHRACDRAFPAPRELRHDDEQLRQWQSLHRWSPNRLRHAAASEIRKRFGLEAAQVVLGHAAADVTQIYAERDLEKGTAVARLIG